MSIIHNNKVEDTIIKNAHLSYLYGKYLDEEYKEFVNKGKLVNYVDSEVCRFEETGKISLPSYFEGMEYKHKLRMNRFLMRY